MHHRPDPALPCVGSGGTAVCQQSEHLYGKIQTGGTEQHHQYCSHRIVDPVKKIRFHYLVHAVSVLANTFVNVRFFLFTSHFSVNSSLFSLLVSVNDVAKLKVRILHSAFSILYFFDYY